MFKEVDWSKGTDNALKQHAENLKSLKEQDSKAAQKGKLIGRFIEEPIADGAAIYVVTKVNKKTAKLQVVTGIGDDWVIPYWGATPIISLEYVKRKIAVREGMDKLFAKNKETA